ncbi:MAG: hypothetical protein J6K65_10500, partial [Alphaproteobacteria bacterium]|nr:hypothetical protein [Alphaproteobacteria bacterium]
VSCDYGCASTNSCGICTSCSGNPDCNVSDKSCDCGCSSTNSCGKCTSCKSCPPSDPCSGVSCGSNAYCSGGSCYCNSGYHKSGSSCVKDEVHSHSYSCPSGYSSSNSWGSSAQTTSKTCSCGAASGTCYKAPAHTHSYSCPSGSQASSCSSSQVQTGTTSKVCSCGAASGTCYSCRAKTCSDGGYSNSSNPSSAYMCSTISYSGLTCYSCRYCGALGNRENYDSSACNGMIASTRTDDCGRTVYKCGLSGGGLLNLCNNYAGVCRQRCNAVGYENWDGTDGGRPAKYCAMAAE